MSVSVPDDDLERATLPDLDAKLLEQLEAYFTAAERLLAADEPGDEPIALRACDLAVGRARLRCRRVRRRRALPTPDNLDDPDALSSPAVDAVTKWSDTPGRTVAEVVAALRGAATQVRALARG